MLQTDWSVHRTPPDTQFHCALLRGILSGIEIPFDFIRVDYLSDPELLKEIACRLEGEHLLPVIRRLGALKDTGAGPLLRFFIKNSSPRIRNEAIAACRSIGDRTWTAAILDFIKEFNRGGSEIDFEQMRSITTALTERTDTAAVLPLIEMLSTAPREYRRLAADALAKIGDRRAIIPLQRCLYVPDGLVVESAICALGSFYDSSSVRLLVDRIDADSSENALVRMGAPALDALFRAFDAGLHSEGADAATMAALGAAKPDEFARRIAAAMKSDYHRERMSAALALGMNRNGNFSAMLKTATNDSISMVRTAALWALWATRDSSMHSGSLGVRPEAELNVFPLTLPQIRAHERRAVGAIASDTTFAIARSFANDCNPGIRYIARFTLKQSGRSIEN
jgi:HEAT repeat protein